VLQAGAQISCAPSPNDAGNPHFSGSWVVSHARPGYKAQYLLTSRFLSKPCCPPSFTFTSFGISDRWRIERSNSARKAPGIPEKTASESGGFFSPRDLASINRLFNRYESLNAF
jgi:hypothetical protein